VCARVGNMVPATLWSSWVGAGPMEWPMDPGLTASAEGSPRPADGVFWPRGWGSISAQGGVDPSKISAPGCTEISEKTCARSRKPAYRDKGAWQRTLRGRKVFTKPQLTQCLESEEKICTERGKIVAEKSGHGGKGCLWELWKLEGGGLV
jgi:hypothetical protein